MTFVAPRISESVLMELKKLATQGTADFSNSAGDLFVLKDMPLAGIRLKIPLDAYLGAVAHRAELIPTGDEDFPIVLNSEVSVVNGKTLINGKVVVLLPEV